MDSRTETRILAAMLLCTALFVVRLSDLWITLYLTADLAREQNLIVRNAGTGWTALFWVNGVTFLVMSLGVVLAMRWRDRVIPSEPGLDLSDFVVAMQGGRRASMRHVVHLAAMFGAFVMIVGTVLIDLSHVLSLVSHRWAGFHNLWITHYVTSFLLMAGALYPLYFVIEHRLYRRAANLSGGPVSAAR